MRSVLTAAKKITPSIVRKFEEVIIYLMYYVWNQRFRAFNVETNEPSSMQLSPSVGNSQFMLARLKDQICVGFRRRSVRCPSRGHLKTHLHCTAGGGHWRLTSHSLSERCRFAINVRTSDDSLGWHGGPAFYRRCHVLVWHQISYGSSQVITHIGDVEKDWGV